MRSRDRTALALAPVFLRLALAVTFLWAGLGKFMARIEVQGEQAAILANYGVLPNPHAGRAAPGSPNTLPDPPDDQAQAPSLTLRLASFQPEDAPGPGAQPESQPAPEQPEPQPAPPSRVLASAADFPDPIKVRQYAGLVLGLHDAIHPALDPDDSSPRMRLWPDLDPTRDFDPWPVRLAWAVALTELIGGALIAIGLLTRIAALGVGGVMIGALWLTAIGPALQSGKTTLGFLPDYPAFDPAWQTPLLQFILLCAAIALFLAGPGALSLDRLLVGGPPRPEPAKPAPAPAKK